MRILLMLTEGLIEEIVYSIILEKLYEGRPCKEIGRTLRKLLEPIERRGGLNVTSLEAIV